MTTTETKNSEALSHFLGNEIVEVAPSDLDQLDYLYQHSDFYIRQMPTNKLVDEKKDQLQVSPNEVSITNPIIVCQTETGEYVIVDGNTRITAYRLLYDEHKDDPAWNFTPIRYIPFIKELTPENLLKYQQLANDTTESHSRLDLAKMAVSYKDERYQYYIDKGHSKKDAKGLSSSDVQSLFGFSGSYYSRLVKLANAPAYIQELFSNGLIQERAVSTLIYELENNPDLEMTTVITALRTDNFDPKSVGAITESMVKNFFSNLRGDDESDDSDNFSSTDTKEKVNFSKDPVEVDAGEMVKLAEDTALAFESIDPNDLPNGQASDEYIGEIVVNALNLIHSMSKFTQLNKRKQAIGLVQELMQLVDVPSELSLLSNDEMLAQKSKLHRLKSSLIKYQEIQGINDTAEYMETDGENTLLVT